MVSRKRVVRPRLEDVLPGMERAMLPILAVRWNVDADQARVRFYEVLAGHEAELRKRVSQGKVAFARFMSRVFASFDGEGALRGPSIERG